MRIEERRTVIVILIAGAVGAVLFMPAVYFLGLWLAPPRPVPETTPATGLIREALWARADGGRATELRPLNPINFLQHRVCRALAARHEDPAVRGERRAECLKQLPAIQGIDYLSGLHMRDNQVAPGLREGLSQFATAAWVTRSWTKESLLDTMAGRGDFGYGWRSIAAASRGYFGRGADELTVAQSAFIASRLGDARTDPWCEPDVAVGMRNRILARMLENAAITQADYAAAQSAPLDLAPPPEDRAPCRP